LSGVTLVLHLSKLGLTHKHKAILKSFPKTNTLAYYENLETAAAKSFTTLGPERFQNLNFVDEIERNLFGNVIKRFLVATTDIRNRLLRWV
jgi:hypothetical protein